MVRLGVKAGLTAIAAALVVGFTVLPAASASGPTPAILPLGDSLTYGVTWAGYDLPAPAVTTPGGYRGYLASDLAAAGVAFSYTGSEEANPPAGANPAGYRHEGHPGLRIDQVEAALPAWSRLEPVRPSVVVLMIGTNDISQGHDPAGQYPAGYDGNSAAERSEFVAHAIGRLEGLVLSLSNVDRGARIVLGTIPPMGVSSPDPTDQAYDQAIRQQVVAWAGQRALHLVLADVGAAFMAQPTYHDLIGPDGVHPTALGYRLMGSVFAGAVSTALGR